MAVAADTRPRPYSWPDWTQSPSRSGIRSKIWSSDRKSASASRPGASGCIVSGCSRSATCSSTERCFSARTCRPALRARRNPSSGRLLRAGSTAGRIDTSQPSTSPRTRRRTAAADGVAARWTSTRAGAGAGGPCRVVTPRSPNGLSMTVVSVPSVTRCSTPPPASTPDSLPSARSATPTLIFSRSPRVVAREFRRKICDAVVPASAGAATAAPRSGVRVTRT